MIYAPYKWTCEYLSDEEWEETRKLLEMNLKTVDFKMIGKGKGRMTLEWSGINK